MAAMEVEEPERPVDLALKAANNKAVTNPKGAVDAYRKLIFELAPVTIQPGEEDDLKDLETAIYKLAEVYIQVGCSCCSGRRPRKCCFPCPSGVASISAGEVVVLVVHCAEADGRVLFGEICT